MYPNLLPKMRAKEAREIPISRYLDCEGIVPVKVRDGGRQLWYQSPIRSGDNTPSFKVDTTLNLWYDHGLSQGGNIIDLVCELKSITVAEALALLEATGLGPTRHNVTDAPRLYTPASKPEIKFAAQVPAGEKEKEGRNNGGAFVAVKVQDVTHPALIQYLQSRAIDVGIAKRYLREVHFRPAGGVGQFFALGFPCGDGYDVRSAVFKGFVGIGKDISVIAGQGSASDNKSVSIFEGFMDFLSLLTHRVTAAPTGDAIILHSTSLKRRATELIKATDYSHVSLYLDADPAGQAAAKYLQKEIAPIPTTDCSSLYAGHNDLNEWLIMNSRISDRRG